MFKAELTSALDYLSKLNWISVDLETSGLDVHTNKILLLAIGDKHRQYVIDIESIGIMPFKEILETKNLILQNAKFDFQFFYELNIIPKGILWDTMLAEQVLYNGIKSREVNLSALTDNYFGFYLSKEERDKIIKRGITIESFEYAGQDIFWLEKIKEEQIQDAIQKEVLKAIRLENAFCPVLAYIEYCGIHLDVEKWKNKYESAEVDLATAELALNNWILTKPDFEHYIDKQLSIFTEYDKDNNPVFKDVLINWSSTKQVLSLFEEIGVNVEDKKNKTGKSINADSLIMQQNDFDIIPLFLTYQIIKKDFTTYGEKFLKNVNPKTGRIHSSFNQLKSTSRLSSSRPNLQNLPADNRTRSCFTAEKGNIMIDCDYKAQEDIIFVNNSKEPKMIDFYKSDESDGHSYVAKLCYPETIGNLPLEQVKKQFPDLRGEAKKAKFAIHYGGTGYTIAKNLNISEDRGNKIEQVYLTAFPKIHEYLEHMKATARRNKYILISPITGRKFWTENWNRMTRYEQDEFVKLACNYPEIYGVAKFRELLEHPNVKSRTISSQVIQECIKGSETRVWRLEQSVKLHECGTSVIILN